MLNIDERGLRGNPDPTGTKPNIEEDKLDASIITGHKEGRRAASRTSSALFVSGRWSAHVDSSLRLEQRS